MLRVLDFLVQTAPDGRLMQILLTQYLQGCNADDVRARFHKREEIMANLNIVSGRNRLTVELQ